MQAFFDSTAGKVVVIAVIIVLLLLIMRGGKICDNTASTGVGGIRIGGTAIFTMTGGEIFGNIGHSWLAGGVHVVDALRVLLAFEKGVEHAGHAPRL